MRCRRIGSGNDIQRIEIKGISEMPEAGLEHAPHLDIASARMERMTQLAIPERPSLLTEPTRLYRGPEARRRLVRRVHVTREALLSDPRASDDPTEDLATLLQRCAAQDRVAFRRLYDRQAARLHGIALRITRQPGLAADAVHETFLALWQHAGSFDPARGSAEAWLTSIARYRALDIARRRAREVTGLELPEAADPEPDALAQLTGGAEATALRRCLEALAPDRRRLVVAAFVDGLSHTELAKALAMPLGTVKSTIRRALATLKRCLEP
jgi:RNA polymerase sigma-70 factor (ECF subfamily)